jgi:serine protease Do
MGIISAKGRRSLKLGNKAEVINQNFLQTDAAINPGNSGGPLIDLHGRIIGVNTAIASNSGGNDGIGFSIPSNLVRRVIDELLVNGKVQRAFLGVRLDDDFDADTAKRLKLERVRGARIVEVYPNTPASRANLKFDDVILSFGGVDVIDENHLINLVSLTPVDKRVKMSIFRSGKRVTMEVVLGDRTDLEERSEAPSRR